MTVSVPEPEIQMDFVVPLKDVTVPEKKQAKFECTITKDVPKVMWYRGDDIITTDQKYDIIDDGKKHILVINCCEFDDEDQYTIAVLGKTSTARLTVEGKCHSNHQQTHDHTVIATPQWLVASVICLIHTNALHWYDYRNQAQISLPANGPDCEGRHHCSV